MAKLGQTISGRIVLGIMAIQVIVLPALYFGMVFIIQENNKDFFLDSIRGHARFLADSLDRIENAGAQAEMVEILDSVLLTGDGVYAELEFDGRSIASSLVDEQLTEPYQDDFDIGQHGDNVYYISVPVLIAGAQARLKVGFDEVSYLEHNARSHRYGMLVIGAYLVILLALMPLISRRVVKPVRDLQRASRKIAAGKTSGPLTAETNLVEFVELSRDLEHMKSELVGTNEKLAQQIKEREHAETERRDLELQLRHSQRLETVGTMAGGIAHELNNMLVPIILYTEMAIEDLPPDGATSEDLRRVLQAAKRGKTIVGQVLAFSRRMAGTGNAPVDMVAVVMESVDLLRASMPPTANLELRIAPNCPAVPGDESLLNQLTLNLLTNALQSLEQSTGDIRVSLDVTEGHDKGSASSPPPGQRRLVCLAVRDTGRGMDTNTRNRIFEPFFTTRMVGEGTGLGLSVVHGIVADLNGFIKVESSLESGSTFYVYLPAVERDLARVPQHNSELS